MTLADIVTALGPAFAGPMAIQHVNELLDPLASRTSSDPNKKKTIMGIFSVALALAALYCAPQLRILHVLQSYADSEHWMCFWDDILSALIISTGTEGVNSIVKFLGYAKEQKKSDAAKSKDEATTGGADKIKTVNRGPNA
jgi:hypothetical protein